MLKIVSIDFLTPLTPPRTQSDLIFISSFASYPRITAKIGHFSKNFLAEIFVFANTPRIIECVEAIKKSASLIFDEILIFYNRLKK